MNGLRQRKAWDVWPVWQDSGERDHIFAESAGKARYAALLRWGDCWDLKIPDIRVRRAEHKDIYLPPEHRLVAELTPHQRSIVAHAYGCDRNGNGYRNHYCTAPGDTDLLHLAWELGLFTGPRGEGAYGDTGIYGGAFFYLTDLGRLVAASMLPTYAD